MFFLKKRGRATSRIVFALGLSSVFTNVAFANDQHYDSLIHQARSGNVQPALRYFDSANDLNNEKIADWMQIASWSHNDALVINLYDRYKMNTLPFRAYQAVATAYRNEKRFSESAQIWKFLTEKDAANVVYQEGYVQTLAESGDHRLAIKKMDSLLKQHPDNRHYLMAAYVYRLAGRHEEELFMTTLAMNTRSAKKEDAGLYHRALKDNQLASVALNDNTSGSDPEARADYAAELVRLAFTPSRSEQERYEIADRALAAYESMLNEWQNKKGFEPYYKRAAVDQLGALLARDKHQDVISKKTRLEREGIMLPEYAQYWVASAYLHEKKPQDASALLKEIFYKDGNVKRDLSESQKSDMFYSYLEKGDFRSAYLLTDNILKNTPAHRYMPGSPTPLANEQWLQGQLFLVELYKYNNDLQTADRMLSKLSQQAPGNQGLKVDYASLLMARGMLRQAEEELKKAELLEPTNINLEIEQSYVALELQEWDDAEALLDDVLKRAPQNPAVKNLKRAHDIHHSAELRVAGTKNLDSNSPDSGKHDSSFEAVLYSPPVVQNWRAFVGFGLIDSHFPEGDGKFNDGLTGLEWRSRDLWMEGEVSSRKIEHGRKTGARFSARYDIDDHFSIGTNVERISGKTPSRALKHGITANSGEVLVNWHKNEGANASFSYSFADFSDGNKRSEFSLGGAKKIWANHSTQVNVTMEMYYGQNKRLDTPYYNPQKIIDVLPAIEVSNTLYENYSTNLTQQVSAGVGNRWEKQYGNGAMTQLSYGQRFSWDDKHSIGANVSWTKRPYDGKREHNLAIGLDMTVRF
ncbi:poly-beta-1,6 N-acetyl-D-glucosamine export porin PgaA [Atlantibacter hermannii]|uniref:poly-beta-1,6 N-acetyl-D-glucosamine export porin PgaA n=1 Tax=Atlantibacter hermannii TaxID=565 RepID=UPI0028AA97FB|nr:poly-beta-1,6 N-acetyl-D-glucosamine export porin PgaA [Atlantibacter hermannii]MDU7388666.1 poly-beta-1,6 N-acetyl-D-glucosamine export porin PgaA [Atlantibacter hermannii]